MRRFGFLLWLYASLAWAAPAQWQQPERLAQIFSAVALHAEYRAGINPLRRWQQPVRVWVEHQVGEQALHNRLIDLHLSHLAQISGLSVRRVERQSQANIEVLLTDQARWSAEVGKRLGGGAVRHTRNSVCLAQSRSKPSGEIVRALVVIPVDQARMHGKLVACIVEELTQVLGLVNDSELAYPSIFNDRSPDDLLTGLDYILLKMLYAPELQPGMPPAQVQQRLTQVIARLNREGELDAAAWQVRRGGLYPLMGM